MSQFPQLLQTAIDADDCRGLAEFYRQLLNLRYRDGDEPPTDGKDTADWLVLVDDCGNRVMAIQEKKDAARTTWPDESVPMQMHMDLTVTSIDDLERHRARAESLGARVLLDRTDDTHEPLYVLAGPAGHPFCLFVG